MSRRVAILGLGARGARWADAFHRSGWRVAGFDPEPSAGSQLRDLRDVRREATISATVQGANFVICCLPDRMELMQMVLHRAQAEAPGEAILAVATQTQDLETVQGCAIRPGQVVRIAEAEDGVLSMDVSDRNAPEVRQQAENVVAELAGILSLDVYDGAADLDQGAESA